MMINPLTERARDLRRNQTIFERKFWSRVRNRQLGGLKFKRQVPVGPYVADFFCEEAALVIELDGEQHGTPEGAARDISKDAFLKSAGFEVFRIWNNVFMRDPVATLDRVLQLASERIKERSKSLTRLR
jgi:very-short-patch-repair endonuclease